MPVLGTPGCEWLWCLADLDKFDLDDLDFPADNACPWLSSFLLIIPVLGSPGLMEKFSSEPRSEPEPDRSELQIWVQVRGFDQNRTVGSVRGSANSRTLANGF
ncbi:hypothetical protein V8E53_013265 [Lactarius tabidus]